MEQKEISSIQRHYIMISLLLKDYLKKNNVPSFDIGISIFVLFFYSKEGANIKIRKLETRIFKLLNKKKKTTFLE